MKQYIILFLSLILLFPISSNSQEAKEQKTNLPGDFIFNNFIDKQDIEWKLEDLDGTLHHSSDYRGNLVLLEFWTPKCGACIKAASTVALYDSLYESQGLQIMCIESIGRSSRKEIKQTKKDYHMDYPILLNGKELAEEYGIKGYPTFFLIDQEGIIRYIHVGYFYGDSKNKFKDLIEKEL